MPIDLINHNPFGSHPNHAPDQPRSAFHDPNAILKEKMAKNANSSKTKELPPDQELELFIARLEERFANLKLVDASSKVKKWVFKEIKNVEHVHQALDYLESMLPESLFGESTLKEWDHSALTLGGAFLKAINSGYKITALFYKIKILSQAEHIVLEARSFFEKNGQAVPAEIVLWEKKINKEKKSLESSRIKDIMKVTKNIFSILKPILKFLPDSVFKTTAQDTLSQLKFIPNTLKSILSIFSFFDTVADLQVYSEQVSKLKLKRTFVQIDEKQLALGRLKQKLPFAPKLNTTNLTLNTPDTYENDLLILIRSHKHGSFQQYVRKQGLELPSNIDSIDRFLTEWADSQEFRSMMLNQFAYVTEKSKCFNQLAENGKNLLEKREARSELLLLKLKPQFVDLLPKIQELMKSDFQKILLEITQKAVDPEATMESLKDIFKEHKLELPPGLNSRQKMIDYLNLITTSHDEHKNLFNQWFFNHSSETLLKKYVQHHETLNLNVKNSLKNLIEIKHEMEGKFLIYNVFHDGLAVAGLITLAVASFTLEITCGLLLLGFLINQIYRPSSSTLTAYWEKANLLFSKLFLSINEYRKWHKHVKLISLIKIMKEIDARPKEERDTVKYKRSLWEFKAIKAEYEKNIEVADSWKEKVQNLEESLNKKSWEDFTRYVKFSPHYNALHQLGKAIHACDYSAFDAETKSLLESQMDLKLDFSDESDRQQALESIKRGLQKFFGLEDSKFVSKLETAC